MEAKPKYFLLATDLTASLAVPLLLRDRWRTYAIVQNRAQARRRSLPAASRQVSARSRCKRIKLQVTAGKSFSAMIADVHQSSTDIVAVGGRAVHSTKTYRILRFADQPRGARRQR